MTNKIPFLFLFFFLSFSFAIGQGSWTQKASVPVNGRIDAISFSIGQKGYFGCGFDTTVGMNNDFWEWDQLTNIWTQRASLPGLPRRRSTSFSIGNKGYVCVGDDSTENFTLEVWEWNQSNNSWTKKADFPGPCRTMTVGFSIGSKGYIGTGEGCGGNLKDFWEYDPTTDTWTQKADFPGLPRYDAEGFSIGNKGYIGGGIRDTGPPFWHADFWEYDQATDTWTKKADLPELRCNAIGFAICEKGYFCTGVNDHGGMNDLIEWNQANNIWTIKASFPANPRLWPIGFSIGNYGYVGMGYTIPPLLNDFWEYTPDSLCYDSLIPPPSEITNIFYIPNIFSPNNDGSNDLLYVRGENIKELTLSIYNRWGEEVFETLDKNFGWDGKYKKKDCETGVYVYVANITFSNGESVFKKGNVTLVR